VAEARPLVRMKAVLAVQAGNPKDIRTWKDVFRNDVTLAQAEPDVAAIGKLTREYFQKSGHWDALKPKTTVMKATVTGVANAVAVRSVDAAIVWNVVVQPTDKNLTAVDLPELNGIHANVSLAILTVSRDHDGALRFARYVTENEQSRQRFEKLGFQWIA